jgi:23S rRNA (uracil1939-C5)-methyltransferase
MQQLHFAFTLRLAFLAFFVWLKLGQLVTHGMNVNSRKRTPATVKRLKTPHLPSSFSSPQSGTSPIKDKDQKLVVKIVEQSEKGDGMAEHGEHKIIIPNTLVGETIQVRILKSDIYKKLDYAKMVGIENPSPDRVDAACSIADRCGGCQLQHQAYPSQLLFKRDRVLAAFDAYECIALVRDKVEPVLAAKNLLRYRNKVQFAFQKQKQKEKQKQKQKQSKSGQTPARQRQRAAIGLFASNSNRAVDTMHCSIQHDLVNDVLGRVRKWLFTHRVPIYDESGPEGRAEGSLRHLVVRFGHDSKELMVCLVSATEHVPHLDEFVASLADMPSVVSVLLHHNPLPGDQVVLLDTVESSAAGSTTVLSGRNHIFDSVAGMRVKVSLQSFVQSNPIQAAVLYGAVAESLSDIGAVGTVWDLYCGVGTIGMYLSRLPCVREVIGVESCLAAVEDAQINALENGIENARFVHGLAEDVIVPSAEATANYNERELGTDAATSAGSNAIRNDDRQRLEMGPRAEDVVVVNPPRRGCHPRLLESIGMSGARTLVYVSCNPKTLARDIQTLVSQHGFAVKRVRPVDMFPNTVHVEVVVLLTKEKEELPSSECTD